MLYTGCLLTGDLHILMSLHFGLEFVSVVTVALIVGLGTLAMILLCVLVIGCICFHRYSHVSCPMSVGSSKVIILPQIN